MNDSARSSHGRRGPTSPGDFQGTIRFGELPPYALCVPLPTKKAIREQLPTLVRGFFLRIPQTDLPRKVRVAITPAGMQSFRVHEIWHYERSPSIVLLEWDARSVQDEERVVPSNLGVFFPNGMVAVWAGNADEFLFSVTVEGELSLVP